MTILRPLGDRPLGRLALIAVTLSAPTGGCAPANFPLVDNGATISPGAIPLPNGNDARNYQQRQAQKAEADDFVFYRREFAMGGVELGPGGSRHLVELFPRIADSRCPIIIEPDPDVPANDLARREAIVARLAAAGFPDPDRRVTIAFPAAEGLYADQAPAIYSQIVNPRSGLGGGSGGFGGNSGNSGGGGGGGFGSGGLGGLGGGFPF